MRRRLGRAEKIYGRKRDLAAAGLEPSLQRRQIGRRIGAELQLAPVDRGLEARPQRRERRPMRLQCRDHGLRQRFARVDAVERVAPPLEADQPGHRLADDVAHLRDLVIERVESEQRLTRLGRREQRGEIPVRIVLADLAGAVREPALVIRLLTHRLRSTGYQSVSTS